MIKMIKPIVNVSKIIDKYNTVILGLRGIVTNGSAINPDIINTLINFKKNDINVVIVSNTADRVETVIKFLHKNKVPLATISAIVTAGEILHYLLKARNNEFKSIGNKYYKLNPSASDDVFYGLNDYQSVDKIEQADFIYVDGVNSKEDTVDKYITHLELAASLNIPLVCAGNDTSTYSDGEIVLGAGAIAEQYATLGGTIITKGKPEAKIFAYAIDGLPNIKKDKTLLIGDNLSSDIKGAKLLGVDSLLISKGVHVNFLGEGYIPDVAKTRDLSSNFDTTPDYVISNLRW